MSLCATSVDRGGERTVYRRGTRKGQPVGKAQDGFAEYLRVRHMASEFPQVTGAEERVTSELAPESTV